MSTCGGTRRQKNAAQFTKKHNLPTAKTGEGGTRSTANTNTQAIDDKTTHILKRGSAQTVVGFYVLIWLNVWNEHSQLKSAERQKKRAAGVLSTGFEKCEPTPCSISREGIIRPPCVSNCNRDSYDASRGASCGVVRSWLRARLVSFSARNYLDFHLGHH